MHDGDYVKEKKRRRKGVIWSLVALVTAWYLLIVSKGISAEMTFISLGLAIISLVILLVSMLRYSNM